MQVFDNDQAKREGWMIWACWPVERDTHVVRRCPRSRMFLSDDDVWTHLIQQAVLSESRYHLSALKFIEVNAPDEFARIECHASLLGISNGVSQNFHLLTQGAAA